jgi:hypothetical protein
MTNIVKNYFRVLEVLSSLNFELEFKSGIGRKPKLCATLIDDRATISKRDKWKNRLSKKH